MIYIVIFLHSLNTGIAIINGKITPANTNYTIDGSSFAKKSNVIGIINLRIVYKGSFPGGSYYQVASSTVKPSGLTILSAICLTQNVQCDAYYYQDGIIKVQSLQTIANPVFLINGCFI